MHIWKVDRESIESNLKHCSPQDREVLLWCYDWCGNRGITLKSFCSDFGVSENTAYKVITGKYKDQEGKPMQVPEKILAVAYEFKRIETERSQYGETVFVETVTVRKIWEQLDLAVESCTPVFIFGASQMGKTTACREYQRKRQKSKTIYVRMRPQSGVKQMVQLIGREFGLDPKLTKDELLNRIVDCITPNTLIIFDEVHLLQNTYLRTNYFNCVEVLRFIYDEARCGMVFILTNLGGDKLSQHRHGELEQFFRRGVHRAQLGKMPSIHDVKAILKSQGLELPSHKEEMELTVEGHTFLRRPRQIIRTLSRTEGLKAITERMRYGQRLSKKNGGKLTWPHFLHADLLIESNNTQAKEWN